MLFALEPLERRAMLSAAVAEVVTIPDSDLLWNIRNELGKWTGDITVADMESLTYLNANSFSIQTLEGLQYAVNLRTLDVGYNPITTLAPIANLKHLVALNIEKCPIDDLTPVSTFTGLVRLNISGFQITNLDLIAPLTQLEDLYIFKTYLNDLSRIGELKNLTGLGLTYCTLTDITYLADLPNLRSLSLVTNNVSDLSPLSGMTKLESLKLWINDVQDLSPLSTLTNLTYLGLDDNLITDITPLLPLKKLQTLRLAMNSISSIAGLDSLPALTSLSLEENAIDIRPGSAPMQVIDTLLDRGVNVTFRPQRDTPFGGGIDAIAPSQDPVASATIVFSRHVTGFDVGDLRLTRNGGANLLTGSETLASADGGYVWTLGGLSSLTAAPGQYTLTVVAGGSGIKDIYGNPLPADFSTQFTILPPTPPGTTGNDTFTLRVNGSNLEIYLNTPVNGSPAFSEPISALPQLMLDGKGGHDRVVLATPAPMPLIIAGMEEATFQAGSFTSLPALAGMIVNIDAAATVAPTANVECAALHIAPGGMLDLGAHELWVTAGSLTEIEAAIGRARGTSAPYWQGKGLTSNLIGANTGVGAFRSADGVIRAKHTWTGDANLDGIVDGEDYSLADAGYLKGMAGYGNGDADYSGGIDGDDFFLIDASYLTQNKALFSRAPVVQTASAAEVAEVAPMAPALLIAAPSQPAAAAGPLAPAAPAEEEETPVWADRV